MKEVFVTAYSRFAKSKLLVICAAAIALMLLGTIVGLAVSTAGAEVGAQKSETILLGGEDVPYSEYYQYLIDECLKIYERDDLSQREKTLLEMEIAEYRFYLQSNTNTTQYYHDSYGAENGGAYWLQVLFFVGLFASMVLPIVLTAWFLPGAKNGVLRTEFLTGKSRAALWGGKTGAALVASSALPMVFSLAGLVSALCAPDAMFLVKDILLGKVYAISVFAQWAADSAAMFVVAWSATALVELGTCISGDSVAGVAVSCAIVLLSIFVSIAVLSIVPEEEGIKYDFSWMPFYGLTCIFQLAPASDEIIMIGAHALAAAIALGVSRFAFGRKTL